MSESTVIIEELKNIHNGDAWHGASLMESLNGITPEQAAAQPLENAHSIWEIASHIAGWENVFRRRLESQDIAEPDAGDFPQTQEVSQQAWAQILADLESEHEKLIRVIAGFSDAMLEENVAHRDYSVRFMLRGLIRHHVYHAGQIALLRKAFTG
jgi:uncharacterized damage-inducible protein DinB